MRRGKKERRNSLSMVLIERAMAGVGVLITEGKGLRWSPQKKCIVNGSGISLTAGQDGTERADECERVHAQMWHVSLSQTFDGIAACKPQFVLTCRLRVGVSYIEYT